MEASKTYTTALAWIPVEAQLWGKVQAVREKHDRVFYRWPPHVNVLYPFVPEEHFEEAAAKLATAFAAIPPTEIRLAEVGHFQHAQNCTAWLKPEGTTDALMQAHAAGVEALPHCNDLSANFGEFRPHMSLGQFQNKRAVEAFAEKLQWSEQTAVCDHLCLISREGKDAPFVIKYIVYLGTGRFERNTDFESRAVPVRTEPQEKKPKKAKTKPTVQREQREQKEPEAAETAVPPGLATDTLLEIDGSMLEGGGQILRSTAALSVVLKRPVRIRNIRAARAKPGLAAQHLAGLELLRDISGGFLQGGQLGSTEIALYPGDGQSGRLVANPHTAGAITLLIQAALPCLVSLPHEIHLDLHGGTHVLCSPSLDHTAHVLLPLLRQFGVDANVTLHRPGFFPLGRGHVSMSLGARADLRGIRLTAQGTPEYAEVYVYGAGPALDAPLVRRVADQTKDVVRTNCPGIRVTVSDDGVLRNSDKLKHSCLGAMVKVVTSTGAILCAEAFQEAGRGQIKSRELVDSIMGRLRLLLSSGACLDEHTADQLMIYAALAQGETELLIAPQSEISTLHLETVSHFMREVAGVKIEITEVENGCRLLRCSGRQSVPPSAA